MSAERGYEVIMVTDGLGLDENGDVKQILNFRVRILEFNEVMNFTVALSARDTIQDVIEDHIAFRKAL